VLNLSENPQIRHKERASQLGEQLLISISLTTKFSFHLAIQAVFTTTPVHQFVQSSRVEIGGIRKKVTLRQPDFIG